MAGKSPAELLSAPAAGWYPDLDHPGFERYWTGTNWLEPRQREQRPTAYPYQLAPTARVFKALIQMFIGIAAVVVIAVYVAIHHKIMFDDKSPQDGMTYLQDGVLQIIGTALAIAAAVELAFTLFTDGPDEALDPLMLGLSATVLLQLSSLHDLGWDTGVALLLSVAALAALFAVRRWLADIKPADNETAKLPCWLDRFFTVVRWPGT